VTDLENCQRNLEIVTERAHNQREEILKLQSDRRELKEELEIQKAIAVALMKGESKLQAKADKLAEALEKVSMFSGNVDAVYGCHLCNKTAKQALAEYRGEQP
jgi:hypothetical protein